MAPNQNIASERADKAAGSETPKAVALRSLSECAVRLNTLAMGVLPGQAGAPVQRAMRAIDAARSAISASAEW